MKKNISKILIGIAIVLIVIAGVVFGIYFFGDKQNTNDVISLGTDIVNNNEENNNSILIDHLLDQLKEEAEELKIERLRSLILQESFTALQVTA